MRYPIAWADVRIKPREERTIVALGEAGSEPILGMVTLDELLLAADPVHRQLIAVPGLLQSRVSGGRTGHRAAISASATEL